MNTAAEPVGALVRQWRERRRFSQLGLALEAEISQRHLSFVESGRARPSRDMILTLAERLDVPLRERNALLLAGGYAPVFPERPLDHPTLAEARAAVEAILAGHEPYPALVVDRRWNMAMANAAVPALLAGVDADLLKPPANVIRLALHPKGLMPRILNLAEIRGHLIHRLERQARITGDLAIDDLIREVSAYPGGKAPGSAEHAGVVLPMRLSSPHGPLAFLSTVTTFGTPIDVTLSELTLETFFPADEVTRKALAAHLAAAKP